MVPLEYFDMAAQLARLTDKNDTRSYLLGCIGERNDGRLISSRNGSVDLSPSVVFNIIPYSHAEVRACRKMDYNSPLLVVVRLRRADGAFALAKPCPTCQIFIASKAVKRVCWSIDDDHYGMCDGCDFDNERVCNF